MKFNSIRSYIIWPILLTTVLATVISGIAAVSYTYNYDVKEYVKAMQEKAQIFSIIAQEHWTDHQKMQEIIDHYTMFIDQPYISIITINGDVIADSRMNLEKQDNQSSFPEVTAAINGNYGQDIRYDAYSNEKMLYVAVPIFAINMTGDDTELLGVARACLDMNDVQKEMLGLLFIYAGALLLVALFVIAVAWIISEKVSHPIKRLRSALIQIADRDFDFNTVKEQRRQDEIGDLARSFNRMSQNLQNTFNNFRSEENKLSAILDNMADGLILSSADEHILMINQAAVQMFKLKDDDTHNTLSEILPEYNLTQLMQSTLNDNQRKERHYETKEHKFINCISIPVSIHDKQNILLLFQDLTQTQSLQTIRRDFLANLAHDMRTPIAVIKASSETLADGALRDETAAVTFIKHINSASDKMTQIVNRIIELAQLESGEVQLHLQENSAAALLAKLQDEFHKTADYQKMTIETLLEKDFLFKADIVYLRRALDNIIHNAFKFTNEGGHIILKARQDEVLGCIFSVYNTGQGITPHETKRIFERFYKGDKSRINSGTGLGLAIVKHIASLHGGQAWVESQVNEYAEFFISIPQ